MNSLQTDFLRASTEKLDNLSEIARSRKELSPEFLREAFRVLHTIKGTAQTFGFSVSSQLAHELESLLCGAKNGAESDYKNILLEGFALLTESFAQPENFSDYQSFSAKIRRFVPEAKPPQNASFSQIPTEIADKLSEFEKNAFRAALENGKSIFRLRADFVMADFAAGFKRLKEELNFRGEIIATLPDPEIDEPGKIGFLVYFAAAPESAGDIRQNFSAEIVRQRMIFAGDTNGIFSQIAEHGTHLARNLGKDVEFKVSIAEIELSDETVSLIFDCLLHLVRNAVDHGLEKPEERAAKEKNSSGLIEISLQSVNKNLQLTVKDDGRGINPANVRAKALEKKLISGEAVLSRTELLDLIFSPEFSTAGTVTEISGRGVGLDAVKNLLENSGGKISVKSEQDRGTTFVIVIPNKI